MALAAAPHFGTRKYLLSPGIDPQPETGVNVGEGDHDQCRDDCVPDLGGHPIFQVSEAAKESEIFARFSSTNSLDDRFRSAMSAS